MGWRKKRDCRLDELNPNNPDTMLLQRMRILYCPHCGKPMKKPPKKREYECGNPRCPVIFVRMHGRVRHIGLEPIRARVTDVGGTS